MNDEHAHTEATTDQPYEAPDIEERTHVAGILGSGCLSGGGPRISY